MNHRADLRIEPAKPDHVPLILEFIRKLADYEKLSHEISADEQKLAKALFGPRPYAEVILAYLDSRPAGFALYFHNFSTFLSRPGIFLEDLFVEPEFRRLGVGKALLIHLAKLAVERGCGRLEWAALDWNKSAIDFYKGLGAKTLTDWIGFRLTGEALERLANGGK